MQIFKICAKIFIMKTFKEILLSPNFYRNLTQNVYKNHRKFRHYSENLASFLINSQNLQPLKYLVRPNLIPHLLSIFPSKRDSSEILFSFDSYPVCVEFNKFDAKEILYRIHADDLIAHKLNLTQYQKVTGYVSKRYLLAYEVEAIDASEIPVKTADEGFKNLATNKKVHDKFEEIRKIIITKNKHIDNLLAQNLNSIPSDYYFNKRGF